MVQDKLKETGERRRSSKRKSSAASSTYQGIIGRTRRESKLASQKRDQESRGTRTRRRTNGGSLSSRGSATGMQCGLCAVLAGLFRRAMCIAGSRRGSGESCYEELATEMQQAQQAHGLELSQQQQQQHHHHPHHHQIGLTAGSPVKIVPPPTSSRSESLGSIHRIKQSIYRPERAAGEITVDDAGQNAVFVRISEDASLPGSGTSPPRASASVGADTPVAPPAYSPEEPEESRAVSSTRLSEPDRLLIENLTVVGRCKTERHTGRFLTMHKRRRKRLLTRSLDQEPGLLDDIFHGQVQCVLQRAGHWRFNAFTLETVTGGRSLPVLCVHLFQWYGLFQRFNLDVVRVWKLFALIEEGYHSTNPYHNSIHATDVTQAMHCFLQEEKIRRHLSSLEVMASLIAAVTHDLDHPGVNQPFLVATSNHLATLYENTSVLENHHWRSAIGCLLESGVSEQLPAQIRPELQRHISSLILATDITRQQEFLLRFKSCLDKNGLDMERPENRHFILQISLKCADISNPCRPWDISRKWSYKVCEEFFRQGDYERRLNLPVTPLCDRSTISIPKIQVGFFEFVVTPLYEEWHRFLGDGLSVSLMQHLRANQKRWEALIALEAAEETKTEMSDLEEMQNSSNSDDDQMTGIREDSGSVDILLPDVAAGFPSSGERRPSLPAEMGPRRVNRRHSVPISVSKPMSLLPMTIEDSRRESLPSERATKPLRNPLFRLEDTETGVEALRELSSLSLLSSKSSIYESAGNASSSCERPVSAENLLPETSIASITSSAEATRLSSVLQPDNLKCGSQTKHLTRQQTFPPLQPYVRIRYMSTTAEMSKCRTETLMEAEDSPSNSDHSPVIDHRQPCCCGGTCTEADCESWRQRNNRDCGSNRLSRDHTQGPEHRGSRRRESAFSEYTRHTLDPTSYITDFPRRHSVQAVRAEDPNLLGYKHRHGRPSSAQEAYPTQMLYASLIGGAKIEPNSEGSDILEFDFQTDSRTDSEPRNSSPKHLVSSRSSLQRREPSSSSVALPVSDKSSPPSKFAEHSMGESELRRYSIPTTEGKTTCAREDSAIRRFTAIPVTSELPAHKFFIGSPPGSPPRVQSVSSLSETGGSSDIRPTSGGDYSAADIVSVGIKRDSDSLRQNNSKIPKLSDDARMKENLDPRAMDDSNKSSITSSRRTNQGWARRRGSAPVGLLSKVDDCPIGSTAVTSRNDRHSARRGSVPTDVLAIQAGGSVRSALGPRGENVPLPRRASLPQEAALSNLLENVFLPNDERENFPVNNNNNNNNNNSAHTGGSNNNGSRRTNEHIAVSGSMPSPRRGSVPADISELRRDLFGRSSVNGKTRSRKKTLRRRSSGGPEMFSGRNVDDNDNGKWGGCKRDITKRDSIPEPSIKRRGSLPVEMVSIFHPGSAAGPRRSSLWRL